MTTRFIFRPRVSLLGADWLTAGPPDCRRAARRTVAFGALAFGLLTLGLAVGAETTKPEWRDPEYGHRLRAARRWQHERPNRPLVVVLGSSRAQMGVSPADMGFPDEPGSPLVYNFGYRCAAPLLMWLQLARLLDDGLKPRAVLVMVSDDEIRSAQLPDNVVRLWAPRFSSTDLRRLAPYADDPGAFDRLGARRNPWVDRRPALVTDLPAGLRMKGDRVHTGSWERMDRFGFSPFPAELITPALPEATLISLRQYHASLVDVERPPASSLRVFGDLTERCRTAGIALALCWAPDCPSYQTTYTAQARGAKEERARGLTATLSVPVFPVPPELTDDDFADGYHLHAKGAKKYSRWLAESHLRAWLAEVLK